MPHLLETIRREAAEAKRDPSMLASFRALRLNLGTAETVESTLLDAGTWARIETDGDDAARSMTDTRSGSILGTSAAMSAAAALLGRSRRARSVAFRRFSLNCRALPSAVWPMVSGNLLSADGRSRRASNGRAARF